MEFFKMKNVKRLLASFLVLAAVFTMFPASEPVEAATSTNVENLITNVSNPSNGKIRFTLNVPANTTVEYKTEMIPHVRMGSLDTTTGSYKNTGNSTKAVTITVTVDYYSPLYTITASYTTGPARNRKYYSDVDNATSALVTTARSTRFVWDEANLRKYKAGQAVGILLVFATGVVVDAFVTKGWVSTKVATVIDLAILGSDLINIDGGTNTCNITYEPIVGWGYEYEVSPCSGGFNKTLVVYDEYGRVYARYSLGKVSTSGYVPVIK